MNRRDFLKLSFGVAAAATVPRLAWSSPENPRQEMYVEVSGRRTGKTERLIAEANKTTGAVVVFPYKRMAEIYQDRITGIATWPGGKYIEPKNARYFYDEFLLWDAPIKEGAYYAGTPVGKYSPKPYIKANGGRYNKYVTNSHTVSYYAGYVDSATIQREFYARF